METEQKNTIQRAEINLQRQLEWVARHDTRASFIAGIAIAMLGVIANLDYTEIEWTTCLYLMVIISVVLLFLSLLFIYLSQYPKTKSNNTSLLFFGTIANSKFEDFIKRFKSLSDGAYLDDLLYQSFINAQILNKKFTFLKIALILLLLAVIPWVLTIYYVKSIF